MKKWILISGELVNLESFDRIHLSQYDGKWSIKFDKLAIQTNTSTGPVRSEQRAEVVLRTVLSFPMENQEIGQRTFSNIVEFLE